jgi:hypothetical protein
MLVPLYGFLKGDTIGLIVLIHDHETIADLASKLQEAASVRVPPTGHADVYYNGELLDPALTVAGVGMQALDRVDVIPKK